MPTKQDPLMQGEFKIDFGILEKSPAAENEPFLGYIEGYASTPDLDREDDIISDEALNKAVDQLKWNSTMFYNHKSLDDPIGMVLDTRHERGKGLYIKAGISKVATKIWTLIQEGILKHFSISGKFGDAEIETREVKGKDKKVRVIKDLDIWEVSVVGIPANPHAHFSQSITKYLDFQDTQLPTIEGGSTIQTGEKIMTDENPKPEDAPPTPETPTVEIDSKLEELQKSSDAKISALEEQVSKLVGTLESAQKAAVEPNPEPEKKTPGITPRTTDARPTPDESGSDFRSNKELEYYLLEKFGDALTNPRVSMIDVLGTPQKRYPLKHPFVKDGKVIYHETVGETL